MLGKAFPTSAEVSREIGCSSENAKFQGLMWRADWARPESSHFQFEQMHLRHSVPLSAVKDPTILLLLYAAPLLEKEGHAHPHVGRPVQLGSEFRQPLRPLREDLERMPRGLFHGAENPSDEAEGNLLVEKVAHAVHEDRPGLLPSHGKVKTLRPEPKIKPLFEVVTGNSTPTLCKDLGIATLATRADLRAARHRIPGRIGPLYCGADTHSP